MTKEDSWANDDVNKFTIEIIFAPDFLAIFTASRTSALSPLWEIAIKIESDYIEIGE